MLHDYFIHLLKWQNIRIPDNSSALNMDNLNDCNSSIYYFSNEMILHPSIVADLCGFLFL